MLFARSILAHPKASLLNQGWALIVLGEAELTLNLHEDALSSYQQARDCFEQDLAEAESDQFISRTASTNQQSNRWKPEMDRCPHCPVPAAGW